jgi:hypothetical protein
VEGLPSLTSYADTPDKWAKNCRPHRPPCRHLLRLDSETYGHNIRETTAPHRAKIHVWSVAVLDGEGQVRGCVLPAASLASPELQHVLEDPSVTKVAHNAPHDVHALANHGITVGGWRDSLGRARLHWPDEMSHGLKALCRFVGMQLRKYEDVLSVPNWITARRKVRACRCGDDKCKKRGKLHERYDYEFEDKVLRGTRVLPLEEVVPGHTKWPELLEYAAEDAVAALKLWLLMDKGVNPAPPPAPWFVEL